MVLSLGLSSPLLKWIIVPVEGTGLGLFVLELEEMGSIWGFVLVVFQLSLGSKLLEGVIVAVEGTFTVLLVKLKQSLFFFDNSGVGLRVGVRVRSGVVGGCLLSGDFTSRV